MQVRVWLCGDDRDDFKQFEPEASPKALSPTEVIYFHENRLSFSSFYVSSSLLFSFDICNKLLTVDLDSSHHGIIKKINIGARSRAGTRQSVSSIPTTWDQDIEPFQ